MIIKIINKDFDKVVYGALEYRKNEIMKFNIAKLKGTKVVVKSNLLRDLNEICSRKN